MIIFSRDRSKYFGGGYYLFCSYTPIEISIAANYFPYRLILFYLTMKKIKKSYMKIFHLNSKVASILLRNILVE